VIGRCEHGNVVKLFGYSTDGPCRCIIYELMSNGSLEDRLSSSVLSISLSFSTTVFYKFYILKSVSQNVIVYTLSAMESFRLLTLLLFGQFIFNNFCTIINRNEYSTK